MTPLEPGGCGGDEFVAEGGSGLFEALKFLPEFFFGGDPAKSGFFSGMTFAPFSLPEFACR